MGVKNQNGVSKFEDLIGFIQRFKNQTAASVANRGELQRVITGWRRVGQGGISGGKERICFSHLLGGRELRGLDPCRLGPQS